MVKFKHKGDFSKTEKMLKKSLGKNYKEVLQQYGRKGVEALVAATPVDSGMTAASWSYEIIQNEAKGTISVVWKNDNFNGWANIAILIQYGHATGNGGYVQGRDYINPALRPIFDQLANAAWKEVTKL